MGSLSWIKQWKPIRAVREERCRRHFDSNSGYGAHWGVFGSFAEATASTPSVVGFNRRETAFDFDDRLDRVFPYDYPVLFWLDRIFTSANALLLFDIGGGVGVHYYAYRKYLEYPARLVWKVCEVAQVLDVGRARAEQSKASALRFTSSIEELRASAVDVVLSAGALHYIERPSLWEVVEHAESRPRHILLNKLPLHDGNEFVSLQNIGSGFSPLHVWNRGRFVERFERLGYEAIDVWSVPERTFQLFDDTVKSFSFSGIYLRLRVA